MTRELLRGLWAASVAACAVLLVASAWLTPERLDGGALAWFGECPARLAGGACALCGMSHSFAAMASLRWHDAARYHAWGPCLFLLVAANFAAGATWAVRRLLRPAGAGLCLRARAVRLQIKKNEVREWAS